MSTGMNAIKVMREIEPELDMTMLISELFDDMEKKKFCFNSMRIITKEGERLWENNQKSFFVPFNVFKDAADLLLAVCDEIDIRIRMHYLKLFRIIVLFTNSNCFDEAMRYIYKIEFRTDTSDVTLPQLHTYYGNFDTSLSDLLVALTMIDVPKNSPLFKRYVRELAFFLTISPRATFREIVLSYVRRTIRLDIGKIARALRELPAFCELRFGLSNFPNLGRSMITALVYRFFFSFSRAEQIGCPISDIDFNDEDQCKSLIAVLYCFTVTRTNLGTRQVMLEPLFDPNDLVIDFICPQFHPIGSHNTANLNFALRLFCKLRTTNASNGKLDECVIRWKNFTSHVSESSEFAVDMGNFMNHLSKICMTKSVDIFVRRNCLSLYQYLNMKFEESCQDLYTQMPSIGEKNEHNNVSSLSKAQQQQQQHNSKANVRGSAVPLIIDPKTECITVPIAHFRSLGVTNDDEEAKKVDRVAWSFK